MFQIIIVILSIISFVLLFYSPIWAWSLIYIPQVILLIMYVVLKTTKYKYIPELSDEANDLFQKYGHFFTKPIGSIDFSSSAGTLLWSTFIMAIIGLFLTYYLGLLFCLVTWVILYPVPTFFNPTGIIARIGAEEFHQEILDYLNKTRAEEYNKFKDNNI